MNRNERQSGQALVMVTMSLSLLLGAMSLVVDLGWGYYRREASQSAADSAAAAAVRAVVAASSSTPVCGSGNVWCGSPAGTATNCPATAPKTATNSYNNACMLAAANGFTTSGSQTVSVQANTTSTPPTVPGVSVSYWVTVQISQSASSFFNIVSAATGGTSLTSNATATAGLITSGAAGSSPCLYILGPSGTTFTLGNAATVTTSSCGVDINSNATTGNKAMFVTGGARLNSPQVQIVGGVTVNNGGCLATSALSACGTLTPKTVATGVTDPFINLPTPSNPGNCTAGNFTNWQATPYTPTAGCYNGFSLANNMSAVMGAGTYVINGGTFSIQGGSTLTGTSGVMVYLTNGATVNIANNATVNMAAQSTGTYEGILFFQDRTMTSPAASTFAGGANTTMTGSLYFPNSLLNINNGSSTNTEAVVAGSVNFQGGATFKQATNQSQTGLPVPTTSVAVLQ
ncbi:MAG TPA: pilus assembly protein TadG-related protein [Bryobacteraceae bacterium]|jgi:hypothetical protein